MGLALSLGLGLGNVPIVSGSTVIPGFDPTVSNAGLTYSNGNKTIADDATTNRTARMANSYAKPVGSYTGQFTINCTLLGSGGGASIGLVDISKTISADGTTLYSQSQAIIVTNDRIVHLSGANPGGVSTTIATGYGTGTVVICRLVNNFVGWAINGVWQNSFDPVTGANGIDISVATNGSTNGLSNVVPAVSIKNCTFVLDATNWN